MLKIVHMKVLAKPYLCESLIPFGSVRLCQPAPGAGAAEMMPAWNRLTTQAALA